MYQVFGKLGTLIILIRELTQKQTITSSQKRMEWISEVLPSDPKKGPISNYTRFKYNKNSC